MTDFDKIKKTVKFDMLLLAILQTLAFVLTVVASQTTAEVELDTLTIVFSLLYIGLYVTGFLSAKQGTKPAGIIGIIMGCILIATILMGDLIDCALGIFLMIHSVKYNKLFNTQGQVGTNPMQQPTQNDPNNQNNQPL